MCIFSNLAEVEATRIFVGTDSPDDRPGSGQSDEHFVFYQNKVANLAASSKSSHPVGSSGLVRPWDSPSGKIRVPGNAMIFPVPSASPLKRESLVSFDRCSSFLSAAWKKVQRQNLEVTRGFDGDAVPKSMSIDVYEVGLYTVVVCDNADPEAVGAVINARVSEERRPTIKSELIEWFNRMYPGWPLVIACFANTASEWSVPFGVFFEPKWPEMLFVPGADAHDGEPPQIGKKVDVNHALMFGADRVSGGVAMRDLLKTGGLAADIDLDLSARLPAEYTGVESKGLLPNGDWVIQLSDVRAGRIDQALARAEPPGMSA